MTALVRETIGFNKERGDSVNLMNTPFQVDVTPVTEVPPATMMFLRLTQQSQMKSNCSWVRMPAAK